MRKILALLLFISSLAFSRDIVTGFCETGAQRVVTQTIQSSTYVQRSNPSCTVTVYNQGTLVKPTIYATFGGAALTNPFTANPDGYYFFWADSGQFDVVLSGSTIQAPVTREAAVGSVAAGGLLASNNLSDVNSISASRTNLGLGGAAVLNVGVITGTVAAGDDSRFPTAGQSAALAGSAGTPGAGNKYITQADVATTTTSSLIPRALVTGLLSPGWLDYTGQYATALQPGFLSAADWATFNAKAASGSYITALTGDMTATGPGSVPATIATNAVTTAKFQQIATATLLGRNTAATGNVEVLTTIPLAVQASITQVGTLVAGSIPYSLLTGAPATQNAASDGVTKGVVTFISSDFTCTAGQCLINYASGQKATSLVSGFLSSADWSTFNGKQAAGNYITALTGNVTATGPGSVAGTLVSMPTGVTQLGYISVTAIAAPSTPAAGFCNQYVDSTSKNMACKNDAGVINHGIQTQAGAANQFIAAINNDGTTTLATAMHQNGFYLTDGTNYLIAPTLYAATTPDALSFAWETTQGTASEAASGKSLIMTVPSATGTNVRMRGVSIGAFTTLQTAMVITEGLQTFHYAGMLIRESASGKLVGITINTQTDSQVALQIMHWAGPTTGGAVAYGNVAYHFGSVAFMRFRIVGANLFYDVSSDGANWANVFTEAKTAAFTTAPDQWGYGADVEGTLLDGSYITLLSFKQS